MTLSEFRDAVVESKIKGWLQSLSLSLGYPHVNYQISLTGATSIYGFVLKQLDGYEHFGSLPTEIDQSKSYFEGLKRGLLQILNENVENIQKWNTSKANLINTNRKIFPSDTAETEFLVQLHATHPKYYGPAYRFLIGDVNALNKESLMGYFLAYEFVSKGSSGMVERKETETRTLSSLRTDFELKLSNVEKSLTAFIIKAKEDVHAELLQNDQLLKKQIADHSDWFNASNNDFESFYKTSNEKVADLESLYRDKLKLEAPAKYWSERAKKLRKEGRGWLIGLITCVVFGVGILVWILNMIANGTLSQMFTTTGIAIKWSVVLVTLISFLAYAIRIISKLTFSSFHLVRDAEEREQLTYVYLALQKEKGIDITERHLVMQSLFSRADSGLLKEDASPTMPGNIVDQITRR
jgi:hypothetical protein